MKVLSNQSLDRFEAAVRHVLEAPCAVEEGLGGGGEGLLLCSRANEAF